MRSSRLHPAKESASARLIASLSCWRMPLVPWLPLCTQAGGERSLEIARKAVMRMQEAYGSDPARIHAAMGPAIGACCFEVGAEVAEQFTPWFTDAKNLTHVNLAEANYRQLLGAGLLPEHIDDPRLCTACDSRRFHSFRRDREQSGRMVAAIGIV